MSNGKASIRSGLITVPVALAAAHWLLRQWYILVGEYVEACSEETAMTCEALLTTMGKAVVTYATRAGGFWLMGRLTPTPRLSA